MGNRTLVIGLPLPGVDYDNYSFSSAPALADYSQVVVEMQEASRVVEEIVHADGEHFTFARQPVLNAPGSTSAFGLGELLRMRERETRWFVDRGGVLVCFAHPDVGHGGINGMEGWRRYSWLPSPESFSYADHLLPTHGRPGAVISDEHHPFAEYARAFQRHIAYRVQVDESVRGFAEFGRVFLRSPGGMAVGVELKVGAGAVIILPPPLIKDMDRRALAETLRGCFDSAGEGTEKQEAASEGPVSKREEPAS